ncbi:AMP-binding enzyme, partial [Nocardia farcinica]|uniref:AMP-binding enzyme n=1 Tax=Nocardia farcinica TaxID=37329 RepID=UPI001E3C16F4
VSTGVPSRQRANAGLDQNPVTSSIIFREGAPSRDPQVLIIAPTADAFEGGWFHSGDLVRTDEEGFVWVVDRKKDMIISGGENIYCAEVENVLFSHPKIREAAVIGRSHDKWGEVPVAIVALNNPDDELTLDELEPFLNENLARYKHPKDLVVVAELPRNASGKVVKVQLRKDYSS